MSALSWTKQCAARCGLVPSQTAAEKKELLKIAVYSDLAALANCSAPTVPLLQEAISLARAEKGRRDIEDKKIADNPILRIVALGDRAKFGDYLRLKSGRDQYSKLKLEKLKQLVTKEDVQIVEATDFSLEDQAKCYRWILRGLPVNHAIRKIKVDLEVTQNVVMSRELRDDFEERTGFDAHQFEE